jgi:hypothetical protein
MKIVTNDYGCGTSSSILDYHPQNVTIVSEGNHKHIFKETDDLLFVGHDFLSYLWMNPVYLKFWKSYRGKKIVWAFEKIDCIIPEWQQNSHGSIEKILEFADEIYVSDEQDARKYGYKWLPQWASRRFFDERGHGIIEERMLFSGQAGKPSYDRRDELLKKILEDDEMVEKLTLTNYDRTMSWDEYVDNLLGHKIVLAPFGNFKGFNTRTYEVLTSGRVLLQQIDSEYEWHINSIKHHKNVVLFETFEELKELVLGSDLGEKFDFEPEKQFLENNLLQRMSLLSVG